MKKYDTYKPSGVEWLGDIPEHWEVKRLKHLIVSKTGFAFPSDKFLEEGIPLVRITDLNENGLVMIEKSPKLPVKYKKYIHDYGLMKNDILFAMTGGTIGKVAIFNEDIEAVLNQRVCLFRIKSNGLRKVIYYWMLTKYWKNYIDLKSIGGAQPNISDSTVLNLKISINPNLSEQEKIAQFLDDKTTKIDKAISIKQQQIELLKERRQILIHQAVTKGVKTLHATSLRDSGVEWIGEIPEGWEVKKLKAHFQLSKGLTITKENLEDEGIWCVNYGEIHSKFGFEVNPKIHKLKCVSVEYLKQNTNSLLNNGDFVFADTSEDIEGSGNFTYLNSSERTFAGYHTVIARPNENIYSRFLAYEFDSQIFRNQIRAKVKGVKVFSITQTILKELQIWIPPISEQIEISNYLDNATTKIATAISLKEQEIEKLKEYKSSLINDVVTGKVKID